MQVRSSIIGIGDVYARCLGMLAFEEVSCTCVFTHRVTHEEVPLARRATPTESRGIGNEITQISFRDNIPMFSQRDSFLRPFVSSARAILHGHPHAHAHAPHPAPGQRSKGVAPPL